MGVARKLIDNICQVVVGKREVAELVVACLLCRGHVLIEDVPGVGKTVLAKALARSLEAKFKRIQLTPDLLPSDITGVPIFSPQTRTFQFREGPVFTSILLADELNRATPRTQSALLESMEERQVTVDGETHPLPEPFFVMATQNPIEQHGVYHLPEAQLDRFLIQVALGYPEQHEEVKVINSQRENHPLEKLEPVVKVDEVIELQQKVQCVHVSPVITEYIVRLCTMTREHQDLLLGGSPRASIALQRMAQAWSLIHGEPYVLPDTVKMLFLPVLRHRIVITPQVRLSGVSADDILCQLLEQVQAPVMPVEE